MTRSNSGCVGAVGLQREHARAAGIGWIPYYEDFEWSGLDFPPEKWDQVMGIDREAWKVQAVQQTELFITLGDRMPKELIFERELMVSRL